MLARPVGRLVVLLVTVAVVLLLVGGTSVLAKVPDVRDRAADLVDQARGDDGAGQSDSQVSASEFGQVRFGYATARLRELVGAPEAKHETTVEGLELECWYYGIVGGSGSYQFCFADGKLRSKFRFVGRTPRRA